MIKMCLKYNLCLLLLLGNLLCMLGCHSNTFASEPESPEEPEQDYNLVFGDESWLTLNKQCQEIMKKLWPTSLEDYNFKNVKHNTDLILSALQLLKNGEDLLLPEGVFDVESILLPRTLNKNQIVGSGLGKTILRRGGFAWNNNNQGDCPLRTEVFVLNKLNNIGIANMTIDGTCHHVAVCGYGGFDDIGNIIDRTPQFPTFSNKDGYPSSSGSVFQVISCNNVKLENVEFKNGFRWCIMIGKVMGFDMHHCIIDTGNLSTEFKGHRDVNNGVMHVHTSQDGIHLVNVCNAVLKNNDIHSEDSAIAIEANPQWVGEGPITSINITISNNYVTTQSPKDPAKLINDDDKIFGTGLSNQWIGQSGVDIFYNEWYDVEGENFAAMENAKIQQITIAQNCFENVRYGIRCGFFIGAGSHHAEHPNHRIYDVAIIDHSSQYMAGRNSDKSAGIKSVKKNTFSNSWNRTGGCGIAVRHSDEVVISNNEISDVMGGIGINIENTSLFTIMDNIIYNIQGDDLGGDTYQDWFGGEGIRIDNYRWGGLAYDAVDFNIKNNRIGKVETYKIGIFNTKNGICKLIENYDLESEKTLVEIENGYKEDNSYVVTE